jgi:hypothetical protein
MEQIHEEATNEQTPPERLRALAKINSTLASLVANNPNASPELLTELACKKQEFIRKNVAANPNTPKEVLWKLGEEFPEVVLENAVLPLLLLENPNLLEEIPRATIVNFLKCPKVPISFIEWAEKIRYYTEVSLSLRMNSKTPRTLLEQLADPEETQLLVNCVGELEGDWQEEFRLQMIRCQEISNLRYHLPDDGDRYFFPILAAMGLVPEDFLKLLANHYEISIRCLAASTERLPLYLLEQLAGDRACWVRATVAKNQSAPPELLEKLSLDKEFEVRAWVAENLNVPPKVLERLATDEQREVRRKVAKSPNALECLLENLAGDDEAFLEVASNSNTPMTVLEELARSKLKRNRRLKKMLALNPNTPVYILEEFESDNRPVIRESLASNPSTPKYILEKFANSTRDRVRMSVADNLQVPEDIIHLLAKDESYLVRSALARNPSVPLAVLEQLFQDRRVRVRRAVAVNPKAPFSFLEKSISELLKYRKKIDLKPILLRFYREKPEGLPLLLELIVKHIKKPSPVAGAIALLHPEMPVKVLEKNARSFYWLERCAIAQNPNTPIETIQLLATDGNRIVRAAAKENLKSQQSNAV